MNRMTRANEAKLLCFLTSSIEEVWTPFVRERQRTLGLKPGQYDIHLVEKGVANAAQQSGVPFCPLIDYFLANESRGPFHLPRDGHFNPASHEITAEGLARCLIQSNIVTIRSIAASTR